MAPDPLRSSALDPTSMTETERLEAGSEKTAERACGPPVPSGALDSSNPREKKSGGCVGPIRRSHQEGGRCRLT
jgi:hypothetical protein